MSSFRSGLRQFRHKGFSSFKAVLVSGIAAAMFCLVLFPIHTDASDKSIVSIYVDGEQQIVSTRAGTVGEVLQRSDIPVGEDDIVEPQLDEVVNSQVFNINIYRARSVLLIDGENEYRIRSAYTSPRLIAENSQEVEVYKEDLYDVKLVQDLLWEGYVGLKVTIDRATPVEIIMDGGRFFVRTQADTVEEMLHEAGIGLGEEDILNLPPDTLIESGMSVEITRVGRRTVSVEEVIERQTETILDNNQPVGYEKERDAGADGRRMVTYEVVFHDGREVERKRLRGVVVEEPENRVIVRGNKPNYNGGPLNEAQVTFLGNCESGMTPTRNSGNGFYGAFQFMPATWRSVNSEYDMPHHAPLAVQIEAVQTLLSRSSIYTQFPSCARQMEAAGLL